MTLQWQRSARPGGGCDRGESPTPTDSASALPLLHCQEPVCCRPAAHCSCQLPPTIPRAGCGGTAPQEHLGARWGRKVLGDDLSHCGSGRAQGGVGKNEGSLEWEPGHLMKGGLRSEGGSRGARWGQKGLLGCQELQKTVTGEVWRQESILCRLTRGYVDSVRQTI